MGSLEPAQRIRGMEIRARYAMSPGLAGRYPQEAFPFQRHRSGAV